MRDKLDYLAQTKRLLREAINGILADRAEPLLTESDLFEDYPSALWVSSPIPSAGSLNGSAADKLLRLNETKQRLREAINAELGIGLTESDPFRSYSSALFEWYISSVIFGAGEQGAWYDPSDLTTLYQDAAGTTPVTADGDPVGLMLDKSGNGIHATQSVAASRPIYRTDGVLHWLEFDGVDDRLTAPMRIPFPVSLAVAMEMDNASNANMYAVGGGYLSSASLGYGTGYYSGGVTSQARTSAGNVSARVSGVASQRIVSCSLFDNVSGSVSLHSNLGDAATGDAAFDPSVPSDDFALGYPDNEVISLHRFKGSIFGAVLASKLVEHESVNKYLAKLAGVTL